MEQNSQISLLPAASGTITAMSGGGMVQSQSGGGQKPFNLSVEQFAAQKAFLEALTDTPLNYDTLSADNSLEYADCKRTILKKLTPKLQEILTKKDKEGITIQIRFTPTN